MSNREGDSAQGAEALYARTLIESGTQLSTGSVPGAQETPPHDDTTRRETSQQGTTSQATRDLIRARLVANEPIVTAVPDAGGPPRRRRWKGTLKWAGIVLVVVGVVIAGVTVGLIRRRDPDQVLLTISPSRMPSEEPSWAPSELPSNSPSQSMPPSVSVVPSQSPSLSIFPSIAPTFLPSEQPSQSMFPSPIPTAVPSELPSFTPLAGLWTQLGADIDGEAEDDLSGYSVSLSEDGRTVAIGAHRNNGNGIASGHVRVFQLVGDAWLQVGSDIDGENDFDFSGFSVSLSADGRTVAIGAHRNGGNGLDSGHVRVHWFAGGAWVQLGADIDGEAEGDNSGRSVSLSADGRTVAIGADWNDGNGDRSGHVRVFHFAGEGWVQLGADIDGEAKWDEFGVSVSLSSDGAAVAIGAYGNGGNGVNSGHVRVFRFVGEAWLQVGGNIDGEAEGDLSGRSVSLSADGSTVAVGAPRNNGNGVYSGHVRIFAFKEEKWVQLGDDINGEAEGDVSGWSVSLSTHGISVAIGAVDNDGSGTGSGHVRVFRFVGENWLQLGADIDGEAEGDRSGESVSLSGDGSTIAIGATRNGGRGFSSGHVRVFKLVPL